MGKNLFWKYGFYACCIVTTCSRRNNVFSWSKTLKQVFLAEKSIFGLMLGNKLVERHSAWT